jgi:hypothetical protein
MLAVTFIDTTDSTIDSTKYLYLDSVKLTVNSSPTAPGFSTTNKSLFAGYGNDNTIKSSLGVRFQNITIPQGSQIQSAYLRLTAYPDSLNLQTNCKLKIRGNITSNSSSFSTSGDYTGRAKTSATVTWDSQSVPSLGTWLSDTVYQSPNIASVIQEIVNQGGWASGNALTLFVEDNGSNSGSMRVAHAFDSTPTKAPELVINYLDSSSSSTYKLVDTVYGELNHIYVDDIPDSALSTSSSLPLGAKTDIVLSNMQSLFMPRNPLSHKQVRAVISDKSSYKVPNNKILFITHLGNGEKYPLTLGATNPTNFTLWKTNADFGYVLLNLPIPCPPSTNLVILSGSGEVYITGYLVDTSENDDIEVIWRKYTTTSVTTQYFGVIYGMYSSSLTNNLIINRGSGTSAVVSGTIGSAFQDPNKKISDGMAATFDLSVPIIVRENDSISTSASDIYVWGLKIKNR